MKKVVLKHTTRNGSQYQAIFAPSHGMNLLSYTLDGIEVIDQTTHQDFLTTYAGHGAMIGPHFHVRPKDKIPEISHPDRFPQYAVMHKKDKPDLFSHGVGRYASWNYENSDTTIRAQISGLDKFEGVTLKEIEGFYFEMTYEAKMTADGLEISLTASSQESPVFVGLHTYYALKDKEGTITANVEDLYNDMGEWKSIPKEWKSPGSHTLVWDLKNPCDYGFHPLPESKATGKAVLKTGDHQVVVSYKAPNDEHALQFWHPEGADFACVEPGGAKNFRKVVSNKSSIDVHIQIVTLLRDQK